MPLTALGGSTGTVVIGDTTTTLFPQTLHPQVMNYISRLSAAGYSPSITEINAVNNLILGMVANGIYAKCDLIYPVLGTSTATVGFDLKNTFNATFSGSWTVASTGMRPTTASTANRADTGWNPFTHGNGTNDHLSAYFRTSSTAANIPIGCGDNVNFFQMNAVAPSTSNMIINNTVSGVMTMSLSTAAGYWIGSRTASNVSRAYVNGIQRGSTSNTAATRPNVPVFLGTRRNGAGYDFPSTIEMAYISIGDGLSLDEVRTYNTLVQAYQTSLGRQV